MPTDKPSTTLSGSTAQPSQGQTGGGQPRSGQQDISRRSEGGALSQRGQGSYFPSPSEFFGNPFAAMRRMQEDMDRMFAQALGGGMMSAGQQGGSGGSMGTWSPAIEVRQRGNQLEVCAELPGLKPDEVHVEVNEDALVIEGERRQEQSSDEGGVHRTERRYGRFYRAIPLPEGANADQARAEFNNGILEVRIPMPEQRSRSRQIPISGGSTQSSQSSGTGQQTQTGTGQHSEAGTTGQTTRK